MPRLRLSRKIFDNLDLDRPPSTWDWITEHVVLTEGLRLYGFAGVDYPYARGICEASDDPRIRELVMVAGTQLGKSVLGQSWLLCRLATQPANAIFASSTEKLATQTARDKLWPMLRGCNVTRPQCPAHAKDESSHQIRLRNATVRVAWSGSPTTLGDWTARWGYGGEVDKWTRQTSDEADAWGLFCKRFGAVNEYQWWAESTPTYEETSRIWRLLIGGSNCRYQVPCPLCGGFQELILGNGKPESGGIVWDKGADGHSDPHVALLTARYRCSKCLKEWGDEDRMPAVRAGIWVPEGCTVQDDAGRLVGEPLRPWPRASFQLSRLYSPRTTWGRLAREYVECAGDPELLRDFYNSTLGLAWRQRRQRAQWEEVAARLAGQHELGTCPPGSILVTAGVDVQLNHFVYWVSAWGLRATGWSLAVGTAATWDELRTKVLDVQWPHADGGPALATELTLIDSRYRQDEVVEACESLCRAGRLVIPYQGVKAGQLVGQKYRKIFPGDADASGRLRRSTRTRDFFALSGNTNWWQSWADRCLYSLSPGADSSYTFHVGSVADQDLWEQLLGEQLDESLDPPRWVEVGGVRHDLRDAWRYSRTAAELDVAGAWSRLAPRIAAAPKITVPAKAAAPHAPPTESAAGERSNWIRRPPPRRSIGRR